MWGVHSARLYADRVRGGREAIGHLIIARHVVLSASSELRSRAY
jgi:hypothetical protein